MYDIVLMSRQYLMCRSVGYSRSNTVLENSKEESYCITLYYMYMDSVVLPWMTCAQTTRQMYAREI